MAYTKPDTSKLLRVFTYELPTTRDRRHAESVSDVSVVSLNAVQQSAKLAQQGIIIIINYSNNYYTYLIIAGNHAASRENLHSVQRLLQKVITQNQDTPNYNTFCEEYSNYVTITEDLETELLNMAQRSGSRSINDATAKVLNQMKNTSRITFLSGSRKEEVVSRRKVYD